MTESHQLPTAGEVFLDHVGLFVPDLKAASPRLQQLGFNLTSIVAHVHGDPPVPSGTNNRCAMFREGYLEVLGPTVDTPLARYLHERLQRYPGMHLLAYAIADAEAEHDLLTDRGFEPLPLVRLQRPVATENGEDIARFSVLRVPPETHPEGRVQMLTHHTPERVWQPRFLRQPNHATALSGVLLCVDDPIEAAERFGRFLNISYDQTEGRTELNLQRGATVFLDQRRFHELRPDVLIPCTPYVAELALRSDDLDASERFLAKQQIAVRRDTANTLYVSPDAALGMGILFHTEDTLSWAN